MIVFLLHGYPNGCFMYEKLVAKLIKHKHVPVAINYRTGTSVEDNIKLVREVFASYPTSHEKAVVAHDWGAVIAWKLYNEFEEYNIKKFFVMSISNKITPPDTFILYMSYQIWLALSKYVPNDVSVYIQSGFTRIEDREFEFDNVNSNYYYDIVNGSKFMLYSLLNIPWLNIKLNENVALYHIASKEDAKVGFVNQELLSEPIVYESHFFYKEYTTKINKQIVRFLA